MKDCYFRWVPFLIFMAFLIGGMVVIGFVVVNDFQTCRECSDETRHVLMSDRIVCFCSWSTLYMLVVLLITKAIFGRD